MNKERPKFRRRSYREVRFERILSSLRHTAHIIIIEMSVGKYLDLVFFYVHSEIEVLLMRTKKKNEDERERQRAEQSEAKGVCVCIRTSADRMKSLAEITRCDNIQLLKERLEMTRRKIIQQVDMFTLIFIASISE